MKQRAIVIAAMLLVGTAAMAQSSYLKILNEKPDTNSPWCAAGVCLSSALLTSDQYTGWFHVAGFAKATIGVTITDGNDSIGNIQVTCQTSGVATTANGAGFDVCSGGTATGTTTLTCPHTWLLATGAAEKFQITVDNLNAEYLNCKFVDNTGADPNDIVSAEVLKRAP